MQAVITYRQNRQWKKGLGEPWDSYHFQKGLITTGMCSLVKWHAKEHGQAGAHRNGPPSGETANVSRFSK